MNYPTCSEIAELSPEQRLKLIEDVWETFEEAPDTLELSQGHREVLDARLERLEKHPEATVSWEDVLVRMRKAS